MVAGGALAAVGPGRGEDEGGDCAVTPAALRSHLQQELEVARAALRDLCHQLGSLGGAGSGQDLPASGRHRATSASPGPGPGGTTVVQPIPACVAPVDDGALGHAFDVERERQEDIRATWELRRQAAMHRFNAEYEDRLQRLAEKEARDQKRVDFQRRILRENVEAARARRMAEQAALQERAQRQAAELRARQDEFDRAEQRAAEAQQRVRAASQRRPVINSGGAAAGAFGFVVEAAGGDDGAPPLTSGTSGTPATSRPAPLEGPQERRLRGLAFARLVFERNKGMGTTKLAPTPMY